MYTLYIAYTWHWYFCSILFSHASITSSGIEHPVPFLLSQLAISIPVSLVKHLTDLQHRVRLYRSGQMARESFTDILAFMSDFGQVECYSCGNKVCNAQEFIKLELRCAHVHLVLGLPAGFGTFGPPLKLRPWTCTYPIIPFSQNHIWLREREPPLKPIILKRI